jgi:hypothetical protein
MTVRNRKLDTLLTLLDGATADHVALEEAFTILAAHVRRHRRDGQRLLYLLRRDGRALVLTCSGSLVHEADLMGDAIAVIARADDSGRVVVAGEYRDHAAGGAIAVAPGSVRDENGPVDTEHGFRWPWSEVAPALAGALRAIPAPKPRPVLCERCRKEFYR